MFIALLDTRASLLLEILFCHYLAYIMTSEVRSNEQRRIYKMRGHRLIELTDFHGTLLALMVVNMLSF